MHTLPSVARKAGASRPCSAILSRNRARTTRKAATHFLSMTHSVAFAIRSMAPTSRSSLRSSTLGWAWILGLVSSGQMAAASLQSSSCSLASWSPQRCVLLSLASMTGPLGQLLHSLLVGGDMFGKADCKQAQAPREAAGNIVNGKLTIAGRGSAQSQAACGDVLAALSGPARL